MKCYYIFLIKPRQGRKTMVNEVFLENDLQKLIEDIEVVLKCRSDRVKELQDEIDEIKKSNAELENKIAELLKGKFQDIAEFLK